MPGPIEGGGPFSPDDKVDLIYVTIQNYVYASTISRQRASDEMRQWWSMRQCVLENGERKEEAERWLRYGTVALNYPVPNVAERDGGTLAMSVIAVEHIIGMYIRELAKGPSIQERAVKAMESVVPLMEQEIKDHAEGEEWKQNQDEDEE